MHAQIFALNFLQSAIRPETLFKPEQNDNWHSLVDFRSSGIEEVDNRHLEHAHERRKERKREKDDRREEIHGYKSAVSKYKRRSIGYLSGAFKPR